MFDYSDAFSKWGHDDGGANYTITANVVYKLSEMGYSCCGHEYEDFYDQEYDWENGWGFHNPAVITKIIRVATGEVVYPIEGFEVGGYDDRDYLEVLPHDIVDMLNKEYPKINYSEVTQGLLSLF